MNIRAMLGRRALPGFGKKIELKKQTHGDWGGGPQKFPPTSRRRRTPYRSLGTSRFIGWRGFNVVRWPVSSPMDPATTQARDTYLFSSQHICFVCALILIRLCEFDVFVAACFPAFKTEVLLSANVFSWGLLFLGRFSAPHWLQGCQGLAAKNGLPNTVFLWPHFTESFPWDGCLQ